MAHSEYKNKQKNLHIYRQNTSEAHMYLKYFRSFVVKKKYHVVLTFN